METIKVIIVEDDYEAAGIYKQFTDQQPGFDVIATAGSGRQALDLLKVVQPHLILLDVFLPDTNGIELLKEIRKQQWGVDVILITAANDTETVSQAIRGGAFGYLIKPIMIDKLIVTLEEYKQMRSQLYEQKKVDQDKVDRMFRTAQLKKQSVTSTAQLPKGIDKHTLKLVREKIKMVEESLNADEFSQLFGISYSTTRRYLEYLVSTHEMEVQVIYGSIGRPERKYKSL
ncbi:response regulator [Domibacillus sp. PGB-M46]|uniref:response regulator n=1 Tax=Domibacillus sp. PGB-M46 TaxID=2910255 RepID=UPI001F58759B|nr:response regulator [Domibacillus sp. PGB-M46]MCI2255353.1 response regulator [Domibacillus sp. PGB-M46]